MAVKRASKRAVKKTAKPAPLVETLAGLPETRPVYDGPKFEFMTVEAPASAIVDRLAPLGAEGWRVVGMSGPMVLLERSV